VTPGAWPLLITDFYPGTREADPQSCFLFYAYAREHRGEAMAVDPAQALTASINAGFCPALRLAFEALSANPETAEGGLRLLCTAAETYGDPMATLMLGTFFEEQGLHPQAFRTFQAAAERGVLPAVAFIGRYFSPLCEQTVGHKSASKARKLFEEVRKREPSEPFSCHELAMMYYNGVGVEKDVKKAEELQAIAKAGLPEIPPLRIVGGEDGGSQGWIVAGVAVAVGVAALITAFRFWRK
jgi:TPR repeat protein